jgi:hypothetical protein
MPACLYSKHRTECSGNTRYQKEPNLHFEFFGHKFTDEDKKNLLETGNMGRVVNLVNSKTGELMPSIISMDRLTNE